MQKEILHIKNFGPITDVKLELGKFTVLIGEQATGKSTIAKVLAVCRYFSYIIGHHVNPPIYDTFLSGLGAWGLKEYLKDSYISYECKDYVFTYQYLLERPMVINDENGNEDTITIPDSSFRLTPKSNVFKVLLNELEKITKTETHDSDWNFPAIPTSFFINDVSKVLDNPFYIPPERSLQSLFSLGKTSIANLSDSLFNQLAEMDSIANKFTNETYIEPLDVYYKNVRGNEFVRKSSEDNYYSLSTGATGYQTTIPIVLIIEYYNQLKKKKPFYIEEPELSLFPAAQNELIKYLVSKGINNGHSILLNTHSPYILTSLNNLMYAYKVGQMEKDKVNKVIDSKYWINPDDVRAYLLKSDGMCENILDDGELKLIDAGKIDEVSRSINADFDKMAHIEFDKD